MLHERIFLPQSLLAIDLESDRRYRLRYGDLVEYTPGKRRLRGRTLSYAFRSVEQLRYDFERDVHSVGGTLG